MAAHQAPPSLGFSRQEHWSGLPFPSPMHESERWKWSHSVMSDLATPWTAAYQAPPSMGFSRQEYWSGVPLPSPIYFLRKRNLNEAIFHFYSVIFSFLLIDMILWFFSLIFVLFSFSQLSHWWSFQQLSFCVVDTISLEKTLMLGKMEERRGERSDRRWNGWMTSLTQGIWVWANSKGLWKTGKPGMLQSMGLQRVEHDRATELNWTEHGSNLKNYTKWKKP